MALAMYIFTLAPISRYVYNDCSHMVVCVCSKGFGTALWPEIAMQTHMTLLPPYLSVCHLVCYYPTALMQLCNMLGTLLFFLV